MPGGRPSIFDDSMEDFLNHVSSGLTISKACKKLGISTQSVYNWFKQHPQFFDAFLKARQLGALIMVDETIDIADDDSGDILEYVNSEGQTYRASNKTRAYRDKLRIDQRNRVAGIYNKYFTTVQRQEVDSTIHATHAIDAPPQETRAQWEARIAAQRQARLEDKPDESE